jgi:predicted ArsR family transcriptional regulator
MEQKIRGYNPTRKTQERILKVVQESSSPLSLTGIAKKLTLDLNQVKGSIEFFEKLGILQTIKSQGGTTLVLYGK